MPYAAGAILLPLCAAVSVDHVLTTSRPDAEHRSGSDVSHRISRRPLHRKVATSTGTYAELLQPGELRVSLLEDRDVRLRLFPQSEEILIRGPGPGRISGQDERPAQL